MCISSKLLTNDFIMHRIRMEGTNAHTCIFEWFQCYVVSTEGHQVHPLFLCIFTLLLNIRGMISLVHRVVITINVHI